MKTITIKQPYATLIAEGLKKYEFRTWKTNYRGEILIHAGFGVDKDALAKYQHLNLDYQQGCIIAKATLVDCIFFDNTNKNILNNQPVYQNIAEDHTWQGYGFKLENIKKIKPIPIKGKLSFWNYEGEIKCQN